MFPNLCAFLVLLPLTGFLCGDVLVPCVQPLTTLAIAVTISFVLCNGSIRFDMLDDPVCQPSRNRHLRVN